MKYLKYILILVIIFSIFSFFNLETNTILLQVNNDINLLDLKNPSIITRNNVSTFKALLVNNINKNIYVNSIDIIVKDSEQNIVCNFNIKLHKMIEIGDKISIEQSVNYDLSNAISFDYIINS